MPSPQPCCTLPRGLVGTGTLQGPQTLPDPSPHLAGPGTEATFLSEPGCWTPTPHQDRGSGSVPCCQGVPDPRHALGGHFSPAKYEPHETLSSAFLGAGRLAEGPLLGRDRPKGPTKVLFLKGCGQQCMLTAVILFY